MTVDFTRAGLLARTVGSCFRHHSEPEIASGPIIGHSMEQGFSVRWPMAELGKNQHSLVLGASGSGKTTLMASALVGEISQAGATNSPNADRATSFLIVDPKNDLAQAVTQAIAATCPERLADLRYLDPFDERFLFPFNLTKLRLPANTSREILALQLAGLIGEISTSQSSQKHLGTGQRQLDLLMHVVLAAIDCEHPQSSLLWAYDALTLPGGLRLLAEMTNNARARQALQSVLVSEELRCSCSSRLRTSLAATTAIEKLIAAQECIDLAELLGPGRICVVNLSQPPGGLLCLQELYANLIVRLALDHLLARTSPWTGHCTRVVIDEAQMVVPVLCGCAEATVCTGRSKGISLILLTQDLVQIAKASDTLLRTLLTNSPYKVIGRLSAASSEILAKEQAPPKGVEETIQHVRRNFVMRVSNLPDRQFYFLAPGRRLRFVTAEVDLNAWRLAAESRSSELERAKSRLRLDNGNGPRMSLLEATADKQKDRSRAKGRSRRSALNQARQPATADSSNIDEKKTKQPRTKWG